ncbi:MAG: trap-type mannitol/chloroaromatic compound transport system large permease component [Syntrophaceae bacterium]|nr:MAG: trap-type mannitol/chloroaromatic compound transport system large permease component [Syntrophaceae bacterium]
MSIELITILLFGALILLLILGLPLAFVLGGVGVVGSYLLWGDRGLYLIATQAYASMGKFTLLAIPLFIFMAMILERAGVADDLYTLMHRWMGPLPGGLAIGTVIICTIFAAMAGISGAATVSMGVIALPAMLNRGYDKTIAMGCISGGGALGILIPPSVPMILYATLTGVSIGGLFAGGILPGLLLASLFIIYIGVRCYFQPNLGPPLPVAERVSWREKFISLRAVLLPIMIIIMVLGSIYAGICTATEASALGCVGALISAVVYRKMSWTLIKEACFRTAALTALIVWILIGAYAFTAVYTGTGAHVLMENIMMSIPGGRWGILITMMIIFFILGCILDPVGIIMICTPVFVPVITALGFDPLWFGVLFIMNMEMGYLTPPFGFNLFYMKAIVPPGITMADIYRSIVPFVIIQGIGLAIVIIFPEIALLLPKLMVN